MKESRRDHYRAPATDADSHAAVQAAIESLGAARNLDTDDTGSRLHLLASLLAQAQLVVPRAVNQAREQDLSWAEIADLLGVTRASAWQRYAPGRDRPDEPQA